MTRNVKRGPQAVRPVRTHISFLSCVAIEGYFVVEYEAILHCKDDARKEPVLVSS